jgi:RNA polymerase sigma-70 factor, ECF subfamily
MTDPNHNCVKLCLDGHPEAYEQLVRRYQAPLLSYLAGRLRNLAQAEDAAQETFVRAFFRLRKLKTPGSFFAWLLGIAGHVAREQRRAQSRYRTAVAAVPPKPAATAPGRDDALEQALAALPEPYARVVALRYFHGLSCGEVARQLGVSVGTVTTQLSRAHGLLRAALRRDEREPESSMVRS